MENDDMMEEPMMEDEDIAGFADDNFEGGEAEADDVEPEDEFGEEEMPEDEFDAEEEAETEKKGFFGKKKKDKKAMKKFEGNEAYSVYQMETSDYRGIMYNFNSKFC